MYVTALGFALAASRASSAPPEFGTVVQAIAADYSRFLYVFEFPTESFEPRAIAVDRAGAAYVTGIALRVDFPTTPCVVQPTAAGFAGVVAKVAPNSSLAYATFFGNASTVPTAIAVDASGNAYITGHAGPGLPTVNALQPTWPAGAPTPSSRD